ncbi:MAG: acyl-CoA thioesterase [Cytophagales bacterium]|nr:acyl-CoA thioesterase [Armatimonadota bacterium]
MTLSATVRVRTYELDSFGHVNNAVYLQYAEEARSEYLIQLGMSFHDFARYVVHLVIVEASVRYHSAARYGDVLEIVGQFRDVRPVTTVIDYTMTEQTTGRLVATATTRGAFVSAATGKPTRAPEAFRLAFLAAASPAAAPE